MIYDFQHEFLWTLLKLNIFSDLDPLEDLNLIYSLCASFENKYSRFKTWNFLDKLNSSDDWVDIDNDFYQMMNFSLELSDLSWWYFDPTIISLLEYYGYDKNYSMKTAQTSDILQWYKNIKLNEKKIKLNNWVKVELWWVWKWYLIDQISKVLDKYDKFCIDFGWDIYCKGNYKIWLEHPLEPGIMIWTIDVDNYAVASSSPSKRKYNNFHHLLNPYTAQPVSEIIGVFTQSSNCFRADWFSTTLFVSPLEKSIEILETQFDLEWMIVFKDWSYYKSQWYKWELFS